MSDELNRLMAEKVMGWEALDEPEAFPVFLNKGKWNEDSFFFREQTAEESKRFVVLPKLPVWNPCGNIEQALMCVDKLISSSAGDVRLVLLVTSDMCTAKISDVFYKKELGGAIHPILSYAIVEAIAKAYKDE